MKGWTGTTRTATAGMFIASALVSCGGGGGGGGGTVVSGPEPTMPAATTAELPAREALIARARALEIDTPYVPPPGDPLEHNTAGYRQDDVLRRVHHRHGSCRRGARVTATSRAPMRSAARSAQPVVDRVKKEVRITMPNGPTLVARYYGSQGCITLPPGATMCFFTPVSRDQRAARSRRRSRGRWATCCRRPRRPRLRHGEGRPGGAMPRSTPAGAYTSAFVVTLQGPHHRRALHGRHHARPRRWSRGRWARASWRR